MDGVDSKLSTLARTLDRIRGICEELKFHQHEIYQQFGVSLPVDGHEMSSRLESLQNFYQLVKETKHPVTTIQSGYFSLIPPELILHIFSFLSWTTLGSFAKVNKELGRLSEEVTLWKALFQEAKFRIFWNVGEDCDWKQLFKWFILSDRAVSISVEGGFSIGMKILQDGEIYKGEWNTQKRHGKGIQIWQAGDCYEGFWKDDRRSGWGIHSWPDGHRYEGEYEDDQRNGFGTFYWPDGRMYKGQYQSDQRNGEGEFIWPNGDRYQGHYKRGHRNGKGTFIWHDGRSYVGEWQNGEYSGWGCYTHRDGSKYVGEWLSNLKHGKGTFYWRDGDAFEGNWEGGRRSGIGVFIPRGSSTRFPQIWNQELRFNKHNKGNIPDLSELEKSPPLDFADPRKRKPEEDSKPDQEDDSTIKKAKVEQ